MRKCIICDSTSHTLLYNDTLVKCNSCSFISANMEISDEELKIIYSENYFKGNEYLDYLSDKLAIQKNFSKRLKQIGIKNNSINTVNALEIGCAYGFFGEVFTKAYKNVTFTGMDIVPEAIDYGKNTLGLNLLLQDYLTFPATGRYTHVFMWDVIEHLPRPDQFIEKIAKETSPGSELHITTGDIGALLPRFQKQKWRMIHPPSHLHYFSKNTITQLLEKNQFEVKAVLYKPVYRSVKQIFYSLFLLNKPGTKLRENIFKRIPEKWFVPLNTYDIMHVIAIKK
jgi:2-polyprenyl-3-methyl-5-hydroxy-6-metoxy-1,4-benzoquinol methylase